MSEALLTILKLCVLALLYLFFFRVLRAVWLEINPPPALERAGAGGSGAAPPAATRTRKRGRKVPTQLTVVEPEDQRGRVIPLVDEMTVGRASGCHVAIPEDTFASQIHARIYSRDGQTWSRRSRRPTGASSPGPPTATSSGGWAPPWWPSPW